MSHSVATLPGANFGLIAVDDFNQIAYGYVQTASGGGIWGLDLTSGHTFPVSLMSAPERGVFGGGYADGWLVWGTLYLSGDWTIQAFNGKSGKVTKLASSQLSDGAGVPVVGHGHVAWNQAASASSDDLRVYDLYTDKITNIDSGTISSPVFAGKYLVWTKTTPGASMPVFTFADADTLQPARTPAELSSPRPINYLAGSDQFLLWMAGDEVTMDYLLIGRRFAYRSDVRHHLQFPELAGNYLVWFGADKNSVVDMLTGSGFDIPLPGSVEAAGDTIVVAKLAPAATKGAITSTTISVLHPSMLSNLPACAA